MATTRYIVNNVTGQTINGQSVTPSYKVYTALLTQSGGDRPLLIGSGEITIGVTYVINKGKGGTGDFTNVGAPNNNDGTYFVATGTTPNEWGDTELEYNEGSPVVTVLENTIGNIWFIYESSGVYTINSNGLFTIGKNWGIADAVFEAATPSTQPVVIDNSGVFGANPPFSIGIKVIGGDFNGDSLLNNTPIEIRVYN
jgi:hypothetical protein